MNFLKWKNSHFLFPSFHCSDITVVAIVLKEISVNFYLRTCLSLILILPQILHLIGYALHEEEQKYSTFFQFTTRAEKWGLEKILEELTSSARVEVHRDLLNFILKKYRQVAYKKSEENMASSSCGESSSDVRIWPDAQEKKYRAKLAAEKRAKIMAQITMQQQLFMKENAALFNETHLSDR